jgi:phosphoglycerate kinase
MSQYKTIDDLENGTSRVLVRADLNVPMKDGVITDTTRIDRTVPTLLELTDKGFGVIVLSHFGRPKGQRVDSMSLKPVAEGLSKSLGGKNVEFADDCIGTPAKKITSEMKPGDIVLLENLRFHSEEENNDRAFAAELASLGDAYVSDAFSCSHRAHASTEALARLLPSAAGRLMQTELDALTNALENPEHPVAALVGGAKISSKMEVLGNLASKVDFLIIGGAMANTFLHAQGVDVGKSLCEHDMASAARDILASAANTSCQVILPTDAVVAREFKEGAASENCSLDAIPVDSMILDIGPESVVALEDVLEKCKTLVWNGPMGAFEISPFDAGTNAVAQAAARLTKAGKLLSVAGGGDTVAALANAGAAGDFSYISTAGGAFLEWLEGKTLPGVAVLRK